jgi:hypothetical protein
MAAVGAIDGGYRHGHVEPYVGARMLSRSSANERETAGGSGRDRSCRELYDGQGTKLSSEAQVVERSCTYEFQSQVTPSQRWARVSDDRPIDLSFGPNVAAALRFPVGRVHLWAR